MNSNSYYLKFLMLLILFFSGISAFAEEDTVITPQSDIPQSDNTKSDKLLLNEIFMHLKVVASNDFDYNLNKGDNINKNTKKLKISVDTCFNNIKTLYPITVILKRDLKNRTLPVESITGSVDCIHYEVNLLDLNIKRNDKIQITMFYKGRKKSNVYHVYELNREKIQTPNSFVYDPRNNGIIPFKNKNVNFGDLLYFTVINVNTIRFDIMINDSLYEEKSLKLPSFSQFDSVFSALNEATKSKGKSNKSASVKQEDEEKKMIDNLSSKVSDLKLKLSALKSLWKLLEEPFPDTTKIRNDATNIMKTSFSDDKANLDDVNVIGLIQKSYFEVKKYVKIMNNKIDALSKDSVIDDKKIKELEKSVEVISVLNEDSIMEIANQINFLTNKIKNEPFKFCKPVQVPYDGSLMKVDILLKDKEKKINDIVVLRDYNIWISHRFKIEFSSGPVLSFLKNNRYSTIDTKDQIITFDTSKGTSDTNFVSGKKFLKYKDDKVDMILGSFLHFSYYPIYCLGFTFSYGIGTGNATETIQHLLGMNFVYGKRIKFSLGGGLALGQAKELKPGFKENTFYEITDNSAPVDNYFKVKSYGSVSIIINDLIKF